MSQQKKRLFYSCWRRILKCGWGGWRGVGGVGWECFFQMLVLNTLAGFGLWSRVGLCPGPTGTCSVFFGKVRPHYF